MALVNRDDKVAFMETTGTPSPKFTRMTKFTTFSQSKNPTEYSRRYVDEHFEQVDVVGYSPSISYAFDQHSENPVHESIAKVHDEELIGDAALRTVVVVDLSAESETSGSFAATKRTYAVIPDTEGDSTDAYTYSGTLRAKSEVVVGTATSADGWETCTFTEDSE